MKYLFLKCCSLRLNEFKKKLDDLDGVLTLPDEYKNILQKIIKKVFEAT